MVRVRVKGSVFGWNGVRQPGETLDVPEEVAEKFPRSLEVIESGYENGDSDENPGADSEGETESGYTRDELEAMEWTELRSLAVESDNSDINGRSSKDDIVEALADG